MKRNGTRENWSGGRVRYAVTVRDLSSMAASGNYATKRRR